MVYFIVTIGMIGAYMFGVAVGRLAHRLDDDHSVKIKVKRVRSVKK